MSKMWLVAKYHFKQETSKRSFLFLLFMLPLMLMLILGVGYVNSHAGRTSAALGYVDPGGLLVRTELPPNGNDIQLVKFATRSSAQAALEGGKISAYILLAENYAASHSAELVYFEAPSYSVLGYFFDVIRLNLMSSQPPAIVERVLDGPDVTVRVMNTGREFPADEPNAEMFVPLVVGTMVLFLTLTTSGYMMEALVTEKENRTIEVIICSVSPSQMMTGKIIGALGIALMQIVVWLVFLIGATWIGSSLLDISWLQDIQPNWRDVIAIVVVALPVYTFMSAILTAVGATLVEIQESDQAGPFIFILMFLPVYLALPILQHPDSPLSVGLSLLPVTSVVTIALRSLFSQVPTWQVVTSAAIASVCGVFAVWVASKALQVSLLRYGQRLKWSDLFSHGRSTAV